MNENNSGTCLPDPTADLHFSDWKGAIQDIFAENAAKFPDRLCVIETASTTSPPRDFTYRQIHEASTVLAFHLLEHGIQRGEVVMIYAYRGVDLVVSVMGVLIAGATFSVVDPAYPPDRQIIYLDVARPKALVIIEKALREEGKLSDQVRTWIEENLDLRAAVPGLELLDDGSLIGGLIDNYGEDVLLPQQPLKGKHPGILIGPDSCPTLSFTSGSEGRPKGVRGRHYSLTHYQPWMRTRWNLSENDRFTMLSGIAHDPIQRDIFTPLFLGALLLVPPKDAIRHVELAQWMGEHKATVTHTTPAMGQILVGGASARFDALRRIFFVGDVLTKRDCRLLQNLASNARIVNMYGRYIRIPSNIHAYRSLGTTETQRAVSYYELPSRNENPHFLDQMGDVIPAGKGMNNVQLLVVDRTSLEKGKPRLCLAGEIGEVFVRAGGLAEGYLGSELNAEKFIPNFFLQDPNIWQNNEKRDVQQTGYSEPWREFWKGPRDRLYRSGDLGRYIDTGDVECTGRADSQVKIRGFRIELGEIDTHLSTIIQHHPLVRENVTLVRRDKDEEPTLVSYVVPDLQKWPRWLEEKGLQDNADDDTMVGMLRRFRLLREDARASLREKLPSYAVPTVIIPLRKFPLTPNYKIDRRVLPYPDAAELATVAFAGNIAKSDFSETERVVGEIWASRIRNISANTIDLEDRFVDLGGHSMIGQEVLFDLRKLKDISLSMNTLFGNPTLRDFAATIDATLQSRLEKGGNTKATPPEMEYALDGEILRSSTLFPSSFPTGVVGPKTVLVTGATGFLGASIIQNLLNRKPEMEVIALVRARSAADALERVKVSCTAYRTWSSSWVSRITCIPSDLSKGSLGINPNIWQMLENNVDVILHNGARVHWIHTYSALKPVNVLSTLECLKLCSTGKPKHLSFISSTSVLDTAAYSASTVLEGDDLGRSRKGLSTGYAQTKYVSEYLIREAGKLGLQGTIIRPGYITGDQDNGGIGPTDDFLLRMLKGSIQLCCRPDLGINSINLVPVSYCASIVVAASLHSSHGDGVIIVHVTPHPQLSFNDFLSTLEGYGYTAPMVPYIEWRAALERYVASEHADMREPHALLPLFDWVTADLPSDTRSNDLDDTNAQAVLKADGWSSTESKVNVTSDTIGAYLAFMAEIKFIPSPPRDGTGKQLPTCNLSEAEKGHLVIVGRGGA
ncbi:MAG: putative NRPS-like protein biosynthetic cluster [Pycnora praestabilis]|nr:MAG: putative NRPS-like protein biosynthetic cluster [Pycnora praestabilis]